LNRTSPNAHTSGQSISDQPATSRRAAKIQERFNALPLDVQQEIMRLREPEARASNLVEARDAHSTLSISTKHSHSEAA
jgi:hypothetical protein